MKEYYLVPTCEMDQILENRKDVNNNNNVTTEDEKKLFRDPKVTQNNVMDLHEQFNRLRREIEQKNKNINNNNVNSNIFPRNQMEKTSQADVSQSILTQGEDLSKTEPGNENMKSLLEDSKDNIKDVSISRIQAQSYMDNFADVIQDGLEVVPRGLINEANGMVKQLIRNGVVSLDEDGYIINRSRGGKVLFRDFMRAIFVRQAKVNHISHFLMKILRNIPDRHIRNPKALELLNSLDYDEDLFYNSNYDFREAQASNLTNTLDYNENSSVEHDESLIKGGRKELYLSWEFI